MSLQFDESFFLTKNPKFCFTRNGLSDSVVDEFSSIWIFAPKTTCGIGDFYVAWHDNFFWVIFVIFKYCEDQKFFSLGLICIEFETRRRRNSFWKEKNWKWFFRSELRMKPPKVSLLPFFPLQIEFKYSRKAIEM